MPDYPVGVPETILFRDKDEALEDFRIVRMGEPSPSVEAIVLAPSPIDTAPVFPGHGAWSSN